MTAADQQHAAPAVPTPGSADAAPVVSYRFALRPKWIVWHVIALAVVVAFTNLGFWQLRRLAERREENAVVMARSDLPPAAIEDLLDPASGADEVSALEFRRVTVTGEYQVADQVLVRNRTNGGAPGYDVVTPVLLADGTAAVVNRGWIPLRFGDPIDPPKFAPPSGRVTVTGVLHPTQVREGMGIEDPADGRLATLSRVDVPRLAQQTSYPVLPAYVDFVAQEPASAVPYPTPVPSRVLDDGPHVNYAGQWFIFTALTLVTYPLLLRRTAHRHNQFPPSVMEPEEAPGVSVDG